jgi:hypothetical protein
VVIPSTVELVGEISVEADHVAGDQVDSANISAQASYQALTINPDDLPDQTRTEIRNQLTVRVPSGFTLTDAPIVFSNPIESSPGSGLLTIDATVDAAARLTPELTAQIQDLASDKSQEDARASLAAVPDIDVLKIQVSPALFVETLPSAGKIEVVAE